MYYNIAKKKPLKIFEFAVPQIQKSNLDWSDNNQGVTIGNHNIQANHGDYWVFTWIWFDSDCSRKNETTHHFSFRQKQVIEPRQSSQRPETLFFVYFKIQNCQIIKSNSCKYTVVTMIGLDVADSYCHSLIIIRSI